MNEAQYRTLCETCDSVLLASDSSLERVANPWLHVVREHPVFLENYAEVFKPAGLAAWIAGWLRAIRFRAGWWRQLWRSRKSAAGHWHDAGTLPECADVLFVSHLVNADHAGRSEDFYFGDVPAALAHSQLSAVVALIDYSGESPGALLDRWPRDAVPRVILSESLSTAQERAMHAGLVLEAARLRARAAVERGEPQRTILRRAAQEALSGNSLTMLRVAVQVAALAAQLQARALVITHEGHAWERVVFAAARRARPGIKCIGYQHAALFRLQHAIRRPLGSAYDPDLILTAGRIGRDQLHKVPALEQVEVVTLGSNRFAAAATTIESPRAASPTCLVLPEGIAAECHLLFEYSLACALACPQVQFIWRLHPIVTYESLLRKNPRLRTLPSNVTLSQRSFAEDIAAARWALYRGSTAIVQAVAAGLQPLYLDRPGEMTIDTLHEIEGHRETVREVADFMRVTAAVDAGATSAAETARDYCNSFFTPLDATVLVAAIGRPS